MADHTPNLALTLPSVDEVGWDDEVNENFRVIDFALGQKQTNIILKGVWQNSFTYMTGDVAYDKTDNTFWTALYPFTSSASPVTFAAERAAQPARWASISYAPINLVSLEAIIALLPRDQPTRVGAAWINGGFLCVVEPQ